MPQNSSAARFPPRHVRARERQPVLLHENPRPSESLRYSRYVDATATHRLRGPEDVARYAALGNRRGIQWTSVPTGSSQTLNVACASVYADETLYAIGVYLMSLEAPKKPPNEAPARSALERGERIFRNEGCRLLSYAAGVYQRQARYPRRGFDPFEGHPNRNDTLNETARLRTYRAPRSERGRGEGLGKVPSLRGLWYRRLLLHDGSLTRLEELLDPARLDPAVRAKGLEPPRSDQARGSGSRAGPLAVDGGESGVARVSAESVIPPPSTRHSPSVRIRRFTCRDGMLQTTGEGSLRRLMIFGR